MSQTKMRLCFAFFSTVSLAVACGGSVARTLPPPDYQEPKLPSWQPESHGEHDALEDALSGGQWVPDESSGLGGAGAELPPESVEETIPSTAN